GEQKWICFSMKAGYPFPLPVEYTGEEAVLCLGQHADEPAQASLRLLSHHTQMKHFFPDYKNYYYFPAEDQAIHKDIAVYADAGHREKAKASNCYQRADGTFLPQMSEIFHPVFFREYRSKPMYFRWEDLKKICENSADDASGNDAGGAAGGNLLHTYLLEILQNLGKGML
ncbi:MAG: hypothetical protein LIV24_02165, partial [Eubacterium sp.]|nr:hypothetical protein [Eubacterium sp.]